MSKSNGKRTSKHTWKRFDPSDKESGDLPFEFAVLGRPISKQTKNKAALRLWKEQCKRESAIAWKPRQPLTCRIRFTLTHFYFPENWECTPDTDNVVKPILDSFQGILYRDDVQIFSFESHRRSLSGSFTYRNVTPQIARGFVSGDEFLYVKMFNLEDAEDLLNVSS